MALIEKSTLRCLLCGKSEQEGHVENCANSPKSDSDSQYDARQVTYKPVLSYVVERILRKRLECLSDSFVDSLVSDINKAIETSERNE